MGDWGWVFPVIVLLFWILGHFLRNDEEKGVARRRPLINDAGDSTRPRRASSEIDRFLEEVRRRRQASEQPQQVVVAEPAPVSRPRPAPPRSQMPPPRTTVAKMNKSPGGRSPRRQVAAEPAVVVEVVSPPPPADVPPPKPLPPAMLVSGDPEPVPQVFAQLFGLIRTRESLQTAILLHEILGPPRCRRRGP